MLTVDNIDSTTARRRRCGASPSPRARKITCVLGRNGVGKTSLLAPSSAPAVRAGRVLLDGTTSPRSRPTSARAANRLRAQGREIFPLLTVRENLETVRAAPRQRARDPDELFDLSPCSNPCSGAAAATVRRPAAAARHRPRAGDTAAGLVWTSPPKASSPPSSGHRPRHLLFARAGQDRHPAGRAIFDFARSLPTPTPSWSAAKRLRQGRAMVRARAGICSVMGSIPGDTFVRNAGRLIQSQDQCSPTPLTLEADASEYRDWSETA